MSTTTQEPNNNSADRLALQHLYDIARAERSFEISQLVQRNNFVMVFQGVLFAGFLQAAANASLPPLVAVTVATVGFFTALAQLWMAAGAKFWQERWELEVEQIELGLKEMFKDEEARKRWFPLFTRDIKDIEERVSSRMSGKIFGYTVAKRWSPSRLPMFVAFVFVVAWFALCFAQVKIVPGVGIQLIKLSGAA